MRRIMLLVLTIIVISGGCKKETNDGQTPPMNSDLRLSKVKYVVNGIVDEEIVFSYDANGRVVKGGGYDKFVYSSNKIIAKYYSAPDTLSDIYTYVDGKLVMWEESFSDWKVTYTYSGEQLVKSEYTDGGVITRSKNYYYSSNLLDSVIQKDGSGIIMDYLIYGYVGDKVVSKKWYDSTRILQGEYSYEWNGDCPKKYKSVNIPNSSYSISNEYQFDQDCENLQSVIVQIQNPNENYTIVYEYENGIGIIPNGEFNFDCELLNLPSFLNVEP